jgi:hypothetical protein
MKCGSEDKRVVAVVEIAGETYTFTSETLARLWADIVLQEFIRGVPFAVVKARLIPAPKEEP